MTPLQRRNYLLHCLEGGLYGGGLAFVAADTVLPPMIRDLGGPTWAIALAPSLLFICFFLPGPFATPLVERRQRLFPFIAFFGAIQRLPYLFAAIAIALCWKSHPAAIPWIVILTPVVSGLAGSVAIPAWMELVTRLIPEHKRASGWAVRFIIGSLIGIAAGLSIHWVLETWPGTFGYAVLHGLTFAFLSLSMVAFLFLRETDFPKPEPVQGHWYRHRLQIYGQIIRKRSPFRRMLMVRFTGYGFMILAPFLSITALDVTQKPESVLGDFVMAQMLGGIVGNVIGGWLGDRFGGKRILILAKALQIGLCVLLAVNQSYPGFLASFFLFGMSLFLLHIGDQTLGIEISPSRRRPAYFALYNFAMVPAAFVSAAVAWAIHLNFEGFAPFSIAAGVAILISIAILTTIKEPRLAANRSPDDSPSRSS